MRYKIGICDDEAGQRDYLQGLVTAWAGKNRYLVELRQYGEAGSFLFDYAQERDFDILLLDVEMPGTSGIQLAKAVREENAGDRKSVV